MARPAMLLAVPFCLSSLVIVPVKSSAILWLVHQPVVGVNYFCGTVFGLIRHFNFASVLAWTGLVLFTVLFVYAIHAIFFKKLNWVRSEHELGYLTEPHETKKSVCNFIQRCRKVGDIPPVFPNGWFALIESHRIQKGEAKPINALGLNLAVFRDEQGRSHIIDAYCPHMGANLAAGGTVVGDCIVCPFHGWHFRGSDGKCMKIPTISEEKIPDVANVKSYISHEMNGWIHLWFDAEEREPYWKIPEIEKISDGSWTYRGRSEHIVSAHIEEIPENGGDVAHLPVVHGPSLLAGSDLRNFVNKWFAFNWHEWTAEWTQMPEPDGHIGHLKMLGQICIFGFKPYFLRIHINGRQIGPGIVYLEFETVFGNGVFLQSLVPVEPMKQKLVHNIYVDHWMPTILAKLYMMGEAMQVERDLMIWNNKRYRSRPVFVKSKEDSLVARHRRWFSQFYSEHSPRLKARRPDDLEW